MSAHRAAFARASLEQLEPLRAVVRAACADAGAPEQVIEELVLAADEVCANVIAHGYEGREPGPIAIAVNDGDGALYITIEDEGRAFDPADAPGPDLDGDWFERRIGGLGWHLVRAVVDELRYERLSATRNRVTLVKRLAPAGEPSTIQ